MRVALTVADFLNRAALVYGRAGGRGRRAGRRRFARARSPTPSSRPGPGAWRWRFDDLGVAHGRAGRHRQPELGPLPHLVLRGERLRAGPRAGQLPAERRRDRPTSSSTPAPSVLLYDPELDRTSSADIAVPHRFASTASTTPRCSRRPPTARSRRAVDGRRGRHLLGQLHLGHDGPARRACSSPTATAGSTRRSSAGTPASATATCCCTRCRCSTATAGACPTP